MYVNCCFEVEVAEAVKAMATAEVEVTVAEKELAEYTWGWWIKQLRQLRQQQQL